METFKPLNHSGPACGTCKYSDYTLMQGHIARVLVCFHSPPGIAVMAAPRGGAQMLTQFPVMLPHQYCHQYQEKPEPSPAETQQAANESTREDVPS